MHVTQGDQILPTLCWEKWYRVSLESFKDGSPLIKGEATVYTDGSKLGGCLGFGFYIDDGTPQGIRESRCLGAQVTVFQAELHAIGAAAETLPEVAGKYIIIYSDSQAALQALDSPLTTSRLVQQTKQALNLASTQWGKTVTLRWVKAHVGHPGNEIADQLAKEGSMNPLRRPERPITVPASYWKAAIKEIIERQWSERFQGHIDLRQSKLWFAEVDRNKSKQLLKLSRHELGQAIQVLTGHAHLRYHDHKVDKKVSPICRLCGEEDETASHLVTECDALNRGRFDSFGTLHSEEIRAHWTAGTLTRFIRTTMGELLHPRAN